jgi:hypothetical protein
MHLPHQHLALGRLLPPLALPVSILLKDSFLKRKMRLLDVYEMNTRSKIFPNLLISETIQ